MNFKKKAKLETGLGGRLKQLRKQRGWSQVELAGMCGVSPPSQSFYENSERVPDAGYLRRLGLLGVDLNWLLMDEPVESNQLSVKEMSEILVQVSDFQREYDMELPGPIAGKIIEELIQLKIKGNRPAVPELQLILNNLQGSQK